MTTIAIVSKNTKLVESLQNQLKNKKNWKFAIKFIHAKYMDKITLADFVYIDDIESDLYKRTYKSLSPSFRNEKLIEKKDLTNLEFEL